MDSSKKRNFYISKGVSLNRKLEIDRIVDQLRIRLNFQEPPLEIGHLEAAIPEIQIVEIANSPITSEILYVDPARKIAQINIRKIESRSSKTLAVCHALGHFFLHPGEDFGCRLDFYGEISEKEAEATYFAETLMIPNQWIKEMYRKMADDYDPIYKLAKCFSVKRQIIEDRLESLELL